MLSSGCRPAQPSVRKPPYYGPTKTLSEVVAGINANNQKIPSLWAHMARNGFDVAFVDDKGHQQEYVLSGMVLYRAPQDVLITAHQDVAGDVLKIGSNDDRYWLIDIKGSDTTWWGRYKYLGADCADPIPIRPDLLLDVLGVSTINTDLTALPAPTMRFNPDEDVYMLIWNARLPDRWIAVREVWYDRATLQPKFVLLFDANGRIVLRAFLSDPKPVQSADLPENEWPRIATHYALYFPETKAKLSLTLDDVRISRNNAPNDFTFRFNPAKPGASKVIQLDKNCGP
jgi:hypothetical protein